MIYIIDSNLKQMPYKIKVLRFKLGLCLIDMIWKKKKDIVSH